ncbi:MAG: HEAT repeat domain-containing protein [Myxococcota bacterium]
MSELPQPYALLLPQLRAPGWRERKEAVAQLRACVADDRHRDDVMAPLADALIDGLLSPDALEGRASCHEVLVAMAPQSATFVMARLDDEDTPPRLLVDLLGELGERAVVPRCAQLLLDASVDPNLQASAASALGRLGGPEALVALRAALESESQMLVVHVLDALDAMRASVPVAELEPLAADPFTRKPAALALGHTKDPAALPVLVPLLEDSMAGVRAAAALALRRLGEGLNAQDESDLLGAAMAQVGETTRTNVRALIHHPELAVRVSAIHLGAWGRDRAAVPAVLEAMDDPLVHEHAFAFVGAVGEGVSAALLEAADESPDARREHLLRLLGAVSPEHVGDAALGVLAQGLGDADEDTALAAAESLASVGTRAALPELYRGMAEPGRRGEAAAEAMAAILHRSGDEVHSDVGMIVGTHWPDAGDLARNLCRVVGALGSSRYAARLVSMLGSADVGVRIAAALAIGQLEGEHEGVGALSFALADEEPQVRAAACRSLGGAPAAVPSLVSATSDDSPLVRAAAVHALVELDNPVSLARLRAIIAEDPVPSVVVAAIAGLGRSGLEQDLTMLMSLCTSKDWEVVKAAARALRNFGAHRATAALLGLLGHERWDVRWTAAEVLEARADATAVASLRGALEAEEDRLVRDVLSRAVAALEAHLS